MYNNSDSLADVSGVAKQPADDKSDRTVSDNADQDDETDQPGGSKDNGHSEGPVDKDLSKDSASGFETHIQNGDVASSKVPDDPPNATNGAILPKIDEKKGGFRFLRIV